MHRPIAVLLAHEGQPQSVVELSRAFDLRAPDNDVIELWLRVVHPASDW